MKWSEIKNLDFEEVKAILEKMDDLDEKNPKCRRRIRNGVTNISEDGKMQIFKVKHIKCLWHMDKDGPTERNYGKLDFLPMRNLNVVTGRQTDGPLLQYSVYGSCGYGSGCSTLTGQKSRTMSLVVGYFYSEELARKAVIDLLKEVGCYGKHNFDLKSGYYKD